VGCISCHTIRYGDLAIGGSVGPDLTHVGGRRSLAAGTLDNSLASMEGWISNPQAIKPGNTMPAVALDADSLRALASYLESLK
jgi:cytochrome c oxidase subunit 2